MEVPETLLKKRKQNEKAREASISSDSLESPESERYVEDTHVVEGAIRGILKYDVLCLVVVV